MEEGEEGQEQSRALTNVLCHPTLLSEYMVSLRLNYIYKACAAPGDLPLTQVSKCTTISMRLK